FAVYCYFSHNSLCRVVLAGLAGACCSLLCNPGAKVVWAGGLNAKRIGGTIASHEYQGFSSLAWVLVPRRRERMDRQRPLVSHREVGAALTRLRQCRKTQPLPP